jgi:hypothetical protein
MERLMDLKALSSTVYHSFTDSTGVNNRERGIDTNPQVFVVVVTESKARKDALHPSHSDE